MESFETRLKRFTTEGVHEIPLTLLNSISNFILPDLRVAKERRLDRLIFLGTHAVIQTIGQKLFGKYGRECTEFYLKNFVDGSTTDTKFSLISADIHNMRNVIAHQLISCKTHDIVFNYRMPEGWKRGADFLHINPDIYTHQFFEAFERSGRIWDYNQHVSDNQLRIRKYQFIKDWLELVRMDPISIEVSKLKSCRTLTDIEAQEDTIKELIVGKYGLT